MNADRSKLELDVFVGSAFGSYLSEIWVDGIGTKGVWGIADEGLAMNGHDLPQWVASIVKEEWPNEVFDLKLMRDASIIGDELLNTLKLALHCVDSSPSARPEVQQVL
jgi:hypothetical protein